jgi:hypothetical protein
MKGTRLRCGWTYEVQAGALSNGIPSSPILIFSKTLVCCELPKEQSCRSPAQLDFGWHGCFLRILPNSYRHSWDVLSELAAFAELGRQDAQLLTVFGHGASGQLNAVLLEKIGNGIVAERFGGILGLDYGFEFVFDAHRRHRVTAVPSFNGGIEKVLKFKNALGSMNVLIVGHPADG